ncbi:MAG: PilZ domain-containing protein [bacterium]
MKNNRKYIRIPESAEISYRLVKNIKTTGALSKDISKGGLRFFVNEFIPKESVLKIKIIIKKIPYSFEVMAKIKWVRKRFANESFEIGAEFIEVPQKDLKHLERYIENINCKSSQQEVNIP